MQMIFIISISFSIEFIQMILQQIHITQTALQANWDK